MSATKGLRAGMLPQTEGGRYAIELALANPSLTTQKLHAKVKERFPEYTEGRLRALIHHYGITVAKRSYNQSEDWRNGKPKAEPPPVPRAAASHTPIHSYSGRSRLLPGYYEL